MYTIEGVYNGAETEETNSISNEKKELKKVVFFVKPGMDSFLEDIIEGVSNDYEVKKIVVKNYKEIDQWMAWADICWFEWCDELIIYGSKLELANEKRIVCRLHRYEAFSDYPSRVDWTKIDKVIFVSEHIRDVLANKVKNLNDKCIVITNGINLEKFKFYQRDKGYNLAWIGYLNLRKNPMIVLQYFSELVKKDSRYHLYFAGSFQDAALMYYMKDMIIRLQIENNTHFDGFVDNDKISEWLKDKQYIVTGSIAEGHPVGVMEAMASGLKPILHYFPGIEKFYPREFIYYTLDDFNRAIDSNYDSNVYRKFIEENYSLEKQVEKIKVCINSAFNLLDKKGILALVKEQLKANKKIGNFLNDVTVSIASYNRGKMLSEDLDMGLKMGNTLKVIVDDCSEREVDYMMDLKKKLEKHNIAHICISEINEGLAKTRLKGIRYIESSNICILDDDDMLLYINEKELQKEVDEFGEEYALIIPRYIVNLYEDNTISMGYDRSLYKNKECKEILKNIAITSEIKVMQAGAIMKTNDFKENVTSSIFDVSEDFVTISKLLQKNLDKRIKVSDNYVHVRRINKNSLSKTITSKKLTTTLLAQTLALQASLKNNLIRNEEITEYLIERGKLLERIYGLGYESALELKRFLIGKSTEEEFIWYLNNEDIHIKNLEEIDKTFRSLNSYNKKVVDIDTPKVSIVIPTYNRSKYLIRALKSALKQSYKNIEIIISDDGSIDNTEECVKPFLKDKRVRYIRNNSNIGLSRNFKNSLYDLVQGKYAIYLSDDDYLVNNNYIKDAIDILEKYEEVSLVISSCKIYDESTQKYQIVKYKIPKIINGMNYFLMYENNEYYPHIVSTVSVFRVDIARKHECFKEKSLEVDLLLYLKLMTEGDVGVIQEESYVYTIHSNNISNNLDGKLSINTIEALEKIKILAIEKGISSKMMDKWIVFRIRKYLSWALDSYIRYGKKEHINLIKIYIRNKYPSLENIIFNNKGL